MDAILPAADGHAMNRKVFAVGATYRRQDA
jgi:hypothetical protein